jgi:VWFA-related protein
MMRLVLLTTVLFSAVPGLSQTPALFKAEVNLVEVYAKVFDKHGNRLENLTKDQFEIKDNGEPCPIVSFEPVTTGFSCAILMDRTGSILTGLPAIKNSIIQFIDAFRDEDWIAVYDFNVMLRKSQDFTRNKSKAKQAVLRVSATGATALYDSISEVLLEMMGRQGKKTIVAFTDGQDNSSFLSSAAVMRRAKMLGIPLYFVAQGKALQEPGLMKTLQEMSRATSGSTYAVTKTADMDGVFRCISEDLRNSYLITYTPPPISDGKWRTIQLTAKGMKGARINSREGYYPALR